MFLKKNGQKSTKIVGFYSMLLCVALNIVLFFGFRPQKKKILQFFFRFRDWPEHDHKTVKLIRRSKTSKKTPGQNSGGCQVAPSWLGYPTLMWSLLTFPPENYVRVSDFPVQRSRKRSLALAVKSQRRGELMSLVSYISLTPPPCGIVLENQKLQYD